MDIQKERRFLVISNIVISVLAAASIVCCFLLPLWQVRISLTFTRDVGDALKGMTTAEKRDGAVMRFTSDTGENGFERLPDGMFGSFVDALCDAGFCLSISESFSSADMLAAIYDGSTERAGDMLDKIVDGFVSDAEKIINDFVFTAAKTAAKEVVKSSVGDILKENYENETYDSFMNELGSDKDRIESLIDRIIDAVMEEGSTVQSVTEVVMESADEAQVILSRVDKYSEQAALYDDDARANVRETAIELLGRFADENGKLNFKDMLIQTVMNAASQALEEMQSGAQSITVPITETALTTGSEPLSSPSALAEKLKTQLKAIVFNFGDGAAAKLIVAAMAVTGALFAVFLFTLFYPILKTLVNIGADDPGFGLFLPIFGGIAAFLMLVILPSILPAAMKLTAAGGAAFSVPAVIIAVLNAVSVTFSSGTVVAFVFALTLFIFSFFYGHQHRSLKKALASAENPQPANDPEQ